MRPVFLFLVFLTFTVAPVSAVDTPQSSWRIVSGTYQYLEGCGEQTRSFFWNISYSGDLVEINVDTAEYKTVNRCTKDGETVFWSAKKEDGSEVSAIRNDDELIVTRVGTGNESVTTLKIDERPWFQPLSYSLQEFLFSAQDQITFWSIRMDTHKPVLLKARKVGAESVMLDNQPVPAMKVEIRPSGLLSMFWHGTYWYRIRDGLFLQHKSDVGPSKSLDRYFVFVGKLEG